MIRARFRVNIPRARAQMKEAVLIKQKKVAFNLLEGIVNMTPVDTGRARGNWMVALGSPDLSSNWEKKDKEGGGTISAGTQTIGNLHDYGAIYLTNNLPYIIALEKGRSQQAPAGMVQVSLDRVTAGLR